MRVGADQSFDNSRHAYVLNFPWNFDYVLDEAEEMQALPYGSYWDKFLVNSRAIVDFNNLYREFHQACSIPDQQMLDRICEPRLAKTVGESLQRIHFHGLDVEMANLRVEQDSFKILKVEVHQNLVVNRALNEQSIKAYKVTENHKMSAASWKTYALADQSKDSRDPLDFLYFDSHRPYLVQMTCLVESPMKLYVQN